MKRFNEFVKDLPVNESVNYEMWRRTNLNQPVAGIKVIIDDPKLRKLVYEVTLIYNRKDEHSFDSVSFKESLRSLRRNKTFNLRVLGNTPTEFFDESVPGEEDVIFANQKEVFDRKVIDQTEKGPDSEKAFKFVYKQYTGGRDFEKDIRAWMRTGGNIIDRIIYP